MKNSEKLDKEILSKEDILREIGKVKLETNDRFIRLLISHLETAMNKKDNPAFIETMEFERIKNLSEKENRRIMIKNSLRGNLKISS